MINISISSVTTKRIIKEYITNLNIKIFEYYKRTKEREEQKHKTDGSKGKNNSKMEDTF